MHRDSKEYQDRKLAWELVQSKEWTDLIKPMMEAKANRRFVHPRSLDESIQLTGDMAEARMAEAFIQQIEKLGKEFIENAPRGQ